jgi:hypothetical protein
MNFLDFSYLRHSPRISFARVDATALPTGCRPLPCVQADRDSSLIPSEKPAHSTFSVASWCEALLSPHGLTANSPEFLRGLLTKAEPRLYSVGGRKRPGGVPADVPLVFVDPALFRGLGITVPEGVYVHRPKERRLVPFRADWESESFSPIKNGQDNYKSRKYCVGYYIVAGGDPELEVSLMRSLAERHLAELDFVLRSREDAREPFRVGRFGIQQSPFIYVLCSENLSAGRWFMDGRLAHNEAYVDG